ncbi:MAG: LysR family transcriptional regulator [Bradyrhizobium sp.]|nr:LysR family transcriptional regulator [Bradyrhizobium sp.]
MAFPRRFLPPTALLAAFETAARTQSFTQAARELNLTQSAVSRQVRALEDMLGAQLFHREKQTVKLTFAGSSYAREVREALVRISNATLGFRANPEGRSLHLAVLPLFGARWLIPRLARFHAAHPGFSINLSTRLAPFDFKRDTVDAAIHFGSSEWPGAELTFLMAEEVVPICSPALLARLGIASPRDLTDAPLLHLVSRPDAWERWFEAMSVDPGEVHGPLFDQFALIAEAARSDLGVALLPRFLVERELASGALVPAVERPLPSQEAYYLAWPDTLKGHEPLDIFKTWIASQVSRSVPVPPA